MNFDRSGGNAPDPDSYEGRKEVRRHERAVTSFIDAHVALKAAGMASERIVRLLCERNEMLGSHGDLLALIRGLQALCSYWGLTGSGKSVSDRQS